MRFAVVGDAGMLGSELSRFLQSRGESMQGFNRTNMDLTSSAKDLAGLFSNFEVIVNCVAYTKVDEAERQEQLANEVNGHFAGKLAEVANILGAKIVYVSTDYVFPGSSALPIRKNDSVFPVNAYGRSKALGEELVTKSGAEYQIFRTAWLYGATGSCFPKAIAKRLLATGEVEVVDDQFGQPTWTRDLCEVIYSHCLTNHSEPVVHAVASGRTNWLSFAKAVADELPDAELFKIERISTTKLNLKAARPLFSVLDNLETKGLIIGNWFDRWKVAASEVLESID